MFGKRSIRLLTRWPKSFLFVCLFNEGGKGCLLLQSFVKCMLCYPFLNKPIISNSKTYLKIQGLLCYILHSYPMAVREKREE